MFRLYKLFLIAALLFITLISSAKKDSGLVFQSNEESEIVIKNINCYPNQPFYRFDISVGSDLNDGTLTYKESVTGIENTITADETYKNEYYVTGINQNNDLEITIKKNSVTKVIYLNAPDCDCVNEYPIAPPKIDDISEYCEGLDPYLEAEVNPEYEVNWYLDPLGGNAISNDNPFVPQNTNQQVYYVAAKKGQCENLVRKKVTIQERSNPKATVLPENIFCSPDIRDWNVKLSVDKGKVTTMNSGIDPEPKSNNEWSISGISKTISVLNVKIEDPIIVADGTKCFSTIDISAPECECGTGEYEIPPAPVLMDDFLGYCEIGEEPEFIVSSNYIANNPNVNYIWYDKNDDEIIRGVPAKFKPGTEGTYSVQAINRTTSCTSEKAYFTLEKNETPEIQEISGSRNCEFKNTDSVRWNVEIKVIGDENPQFLCTFNNITISPLKIETQPNNTYIVYVKGGYSLTVNSSSSSGCNISKTLLPEKCNCPPQSQIASKPSILSEPGCNNITLTAFGKPGLEYVWEAPVGNVAITNDKAVINRLQTGDYYVYQVDEGCPGEISDKITIRETTFLKKPLVRPLVAKPDNFPVLLIYDRDSNYTFNWFKDGAPTNTNGRYLYDSNIGNDTIMLVVSHKLNQCLDTMYYPKKDKSSSIQGFLISEYTNTYENQVGIFRIFPNPGDKEVNIGINPELLAEGDIVCRIFDLTGKCIHQFNIEYNIHTINTEQLVSGIYTVVFFADDIKLQTQKLVIR